MAASTSLMEENDSVLNFDQENMPISRVLTSMGISVNKQNHVTRLKVAFDYFNATYLETLDFLTNILPVAKQQFGKHDNLLLPKTPKRKRRKRNKPIDEEDEENMHPNVTNECYKLNTESSLLNIEPEKRPRRSPRVVLVLENVDKDEPKRTSLEGARHKAKTTESEAMVVAENDRDTPNMETDLYVDLNSKKSDSEDSGIDSVEAPLAVDAPVAVDTPVAMDTRVFMDTPVDMVITPVAMVITPLAMVFTPVARDLPVAMGPTEVVKRTRSKSSQEDVVEEVVMSSSDEKIDCPSNNNKDDMNVLNKEKPQETVTIMSEDIQLASDNILEQQSTEGNSQDESENLALSKRETRSSAQYRPVRRSTRLSRRASSKLSVSTQAKRRSSRRLSRRSSCFKKPQAIRNIVCTISCDDEISESTGSESVYMDCQLEATEQIVQPVLSEDSSKESEGEESELLKSPAPSTSTPELNKDEGVLVPCFPKLSFKPDSSGYEAAEPSGKVAGMIQEIYRNSRFRDEQSSVGRTPNGRKKIKRLNSTAMKTRKPSNIVGGGGANIRSFIKCPSAKKLDANELVRLKKLELQRKEEKEKERKDQAELRKKNWIEEQKRKREERQKRVAETKAAREKEEKEKKQRQLEERKHMLQALEQTRKKREQEEEDKKKLREQRKKDTDARRLKEEEERLKRIQEKEEEEKMYQDMLKRKQEQDEQERKQRILEEKRLQEQKGRERQREQAEERERRLRDIKEKQQKREEEEQRALAEEKKKKEDKEKKQKEHEDREKKRIAQLIKEKMEQEKKLWEEKREKEERERREREEQRRQREASKLNQASAANKSLVQTKSVDSYMMTPPPVPIRKPSTNDNYNIDDIKSDESTDDEDCPRKKVPAWAQGAALKAALLNQSEPRRLFELETGPYFEQFPDLDKIFMKKRKRFYQRTSSAHWGTPPLKKAIV